jgi:N-acetylmuramoyl-L-alanine amidase
MLSGGSIRGGRWTACVATLLSLAACQTTQPESSRPGPTLVSATEFAARLRLERRALDDTGRMALTNSVGQPEIVLFPETTIVSVRGAQYTASCDVELRGDEAWLTKDDASAIEIMWQSTPVPTSPWREPYLRPIGPPSTFSSGTTTPLPPTTSPRGPYGDQPTADEKRLWSVPLKRDWKYVVVHHSAGDSGNAKEFDAFHKSKGWDGLAYDFVIDNGRGGADGKVEIGYRWREQARGAHSGNDEMNERGVGICLVGDFTRRPPTAAQMRSLSRLCNFLSAYCGIPRDNYVRHGDVKKTQCPGPLFPQDFFPSSRAVVGTK